MRLKNLRQRVGLRDLLGREALAERGQEWSGEVTVRATDSEQFLASAPTILHPQEILREYVPEAGVWFLRAQNVRPLLIDDTARVFLSEKDAELLPQNRVLFGDVLLTRTGANRGDCAYFDSHDPAIACSHTFIIRSKRWNHAFLTAFLSCRYGRLQIDKGVYGAAQPEVAPYFLRRIWIPRVSPAFQSAIERTFLDAAEHRNRARASAAKGEHDLLQALGLANWRPPEPLAYIRPASEAFAAGRLDAEHFQPKYQAIIDQMRRAGHTLVQLQKIMLPVKNGFDWRDFTETGTPYIRVGDVAGCRLQLEAAARVQVRAQDIKKDIALRVGDVLFTRKGSYGNAAPVRPGEEHAIISSEIMLIRLRDQYTSSVSTEFLAMFLNSIGGAYQAEQWAHGVAFYSVAQDDLNQFLIPLVPSPIQNGLKQQLEKSDTARRRARALLNAAMRAVEITIEDSEPTALAYLKTQEP